MGVQKFEVIKEKPKDDGVDKKQLEIDEKYQNVYVGGRLIPKEELIFVEDTLNGLLEYTRRKLAKNFFGAGKQE